MPCRTIAVANQKGGTGKTATSLSLGVALARRGKRVLLVDTDPQGDLTKSLGWKDPDALEVTLANHLGAVIEGEGLEPREGILEHKEGIDLMPANVELAGMEMPILMAMSREQLVNVWVSPLKADYDFVIFDCAPTLGIIPVNAFVASDSVLIPVSTEYLPASAMTGLLKTIGRVRRQINPALSVGGASSSRSRTAATTLPARSSRPFVSSMGIPTASLMPSFPAPSQRPSHPPSA